jgi:tetratricopeptide (TPR) repeat protein
MTYYREAAAAARQVYANAEAAHLLRDALALVQSLPADGTRQEVSAALYEELGELQEISGQFEEAREAFQEALAATPACERLRQARLYRKIGNSWRLVVDSEKAIQAFDIAKSLCGEQPAGPDAEWWNEWLEIHFAELWALYLANDVTTMTELADKIRLPVEQYGTPVQRSVFLSRLLLMMLRRDRFRVSDLTMRCATAALSVSRETGDLDATAFDQFGVGFCCLWRRELDRAEEEMLAALTLAEQVGDLMLQSRCLTYLAIVYRARGDVDKVRAYINRSLQAAGSGQVVEYAAVAWANQAWVAWVEGNLQEAEERGRQATDFWEEQLLVYPFQWTARWPLIGVTLARGRIAEAVEHASAMLRPVQIRLPDELGAALQDAVAAWEAGCGEAASQKLHEAMELARKTGWF